MMTDLQKPVYSKLGPHHSMVNKWQEYLKRWDQAGYIPLGSGPPKDVWLASFPRCVFPQAPAV